MLYFSKRKTRKYKTDYKTKDIYNFYKKNHNNVVESQLWRTIVEEYSNEIIHSIIYDHIIFNLPYRLGKIRILKKKTKIDITEDGKVNTTRLAADWKKTKILWEKKYPDKTASEIKAIPIEEKGMVYILNEHTNGYRFRFLWDKTSSNVKNQNYYMFKPTRKSNREITKAIATDTQLQFYYFE